MQFDLGCELSYTLNSPGTLVFNLHAAQNESQRVLSEDLQLDPPLTFDDYNDPSEGNRYFRLNVQRGPLNVRYQATVESKPLRHAPLSIQEVPPSQLPLQCLPYLYPSRYCQSDRLTRLAYAQFGNVGMGYTRVTAICNWIYDNIQYLRGSSDEHTSAFDIVTERAGVCRDFAHLGIAFCRALQIPARFVTAYAYGLVPPDFHAVFEAYLSGRWYVFDATRQAPQEGIVRIGAGRDAADVSFATLFGGVGFDGMKVWIAPSGSGANAQDGPPVTLAPTVEAIAIS